MVAGMTNSTPQVRSGRTGRLMAGLGNSVLSKVPVAPAADASGVVVTVNQPGGPRAFPRRRFAWAITGMSGEGGCLTHLGEFHRWQQSLANSPTGYQMAV